MRYSVFIIFTLLVLVPHSFAQELNLPSNPLDGRIVFEDKGCIICHAVSGYGGSLAPDLAKQKYYGSFLELASIIWNHIPEMNRKFRQLKMERPHFNKKEMSDLIYFIYYLRYLGEPGSVSNGKKLLSTKGCINCHQVSGKSGNAAPDFSQLQQYASPVYIAQAMWNHGPTMMETMNDLNIKFPEISGEDIADITAYIRQATMTGTELRMSPGNPSKGKLVFKMKGCINCHETKTAEGKTAPILSEIKLNRSVTEIAALMWNHSPAMVEFMKEESIKYPQLKENEMADLIAYLYFLGFEDPPGDPYEGELIFADKGCANCHEENGKGIGPDLSGMKSMKSRIIILQHMWNHASRMEDLLLIKNNKWPELTAKELQDLSEYLKTLSQNK